MAKKKRKRRKRRPGPSLAPDRPQVLQSVSRLPDRAERTLWRIARLLREQEPGSVDEANEFLQQVIDDAASAGDLTSLERAQEKMYDAWEADGEMRITLATEALDISPDCADAYVLLAGESVESAEEALAILEQGVEAGKRGLGPKYFEESVGHFWGLLETRPYMRALASLAVCLMCLDERKRAIALCRELLVLNPEDNQGNRNLLIKLLLLEGHDEEAGELLSKYEEATTFWAYANALWVFRTRGESEEALEALMQAFNQNPHVPMYVANVLELPDGLAEFYSPGSEEEAEVCVGHYFEPWVETPRAMEWLLGIVAAILDEFANEESRRPKRRKSKAR